MVNVGMIRTVIGIIGNVISFGLFVSPFPTFVSICKQKSVQNFRPDPYLATVLNCGLWTFYGLPFVTEDNILVITINCFGFVLELIYCIIFYVYSTWNKRKKILLALLAEFILLAVVIVLVMLLVHEPKTRMLIVGPICIVFNIIMYAAPLTVMRQVIRTKSVKYMPFLLSFTNFASGAVWTAYAVLKWDIFIVIPNAMGTVSGLAQLILYAIYYRSTNWNEDSTTETV